MDAFLPLAAALLTLVVMEVVLGIDNLVFVALVSNKLPPHQRSRGRRIGIVLALAMRLVLLSAIAWLAGVTRPLFDLGIQGAPGADGHPSFDTAFSLRDLILLGGGVFLLWKATSEIGHNLTSGRDHDGTQSETGRGPVLGFGAAIAQIIVLDLVFSIDSILTAVGMTDHLGVMIAAVVIAVGLMMVAADPLANFIGRHPSVVMLALGFLLMIGTVLIAEGFGAHVPKGYIYTAMGFSGAIEALNIFRRRARSGG